MGRTYEGQLSASGLRAALIVSRFNAFITDRLRDGAVDTLVRSGASPEDVDVVMVPGAFEIPLAAKVAAASGRYDAVIAIGCVIRGATPHFDYVAGEVTKGVGAAALDTGVPIAFGVLTTDTIAQAIERAGTKAGNKGAEAATSAIEMVGVMRALEGTD